MEQKIADELDAQARLNSWLKERTRILLNHMEESFQTTPYGFFDEGPCPGIDPVSDNTVPTQSKHGLK